jgi:hypothetical protein
MIVATSPCPQACRGWYIDCVRLVLRAGGGELCGKLGGSSVPDHKLELNEYIRAVNAWTSGQYLGSRLAFTTSTGRMLDVRGTRFAEEADEASHRRFLAPAGSQIVGLTFDGDRLVGVRTASDAPPPVLEAPVPAAQAPPAEEPLPAEEIDAETEDEHDLDDADDSDDVSRSASTMSMSM